MLTLLITKELIKDYEELKPLLALMNEYPDGFTIKELLEGKITGLKNDNIIHYFYYNLPLTGSDKELYLEKMKINKCVAFFSCYDIEDCYSIANSQFCKSSNYIYDSKYIDNSAEIYDSLEIEDSISVHNSNSIFESNNIYNSEWITRGKNITKSKNILDSTNIAYSGIIKNSHFTIECSNGDNIIFSRKLINCSNKIFCFEIENNHDFMIFNKIVSEKTFNLVKHFLLDLLKDKTLITKLEGSNTLLPAITIFYNTFKGKADFWQKIKEYVINYDQKLLYDITLSEGIFEN